MPLAIKADKRFQQRGITIGKGKFREARLEYEEQGRDKNGEAYKYMLNYVGWWHQSSFHPNFKKRK